MVKTAKISQVYPELDTGWVDPPVGLGRVGSSDQICQKIAQCLSSVICTVVLTIFSLNKSVKCFS